MTAHRPTAISFIDQYAAEWHTATHHPFLTGIRDGSLAAQAFKRWLEQDYLFVGDLLHFQARLVARAPRADQSVLIAGLVALESELGWFEEHAGRIGLVFGSPHHATTQRYQEFLVSLDAVPYAAAITALWAIERAYLEAWRDAMPGAAAFTEFVAHWTDPAFAEYVSGLERAVDVALDTANHEEARIAFVNVARLEAAFWDIATA